MEPVDVKTVSYFNVSAVMFTLANWLLINESFLQELLMMQITREKIKSMGRLFFIVQMYSYLY